MRKIICCHVERSGLMEPERMFVVKIEFWRKFLKRLLIVPSGNTMAHQHIKLKVATPTSL